MVLTVRHPVVENMYCTFNPDSVESTPVPAGRLVRVVGETTDGRAIVDLVSDSSAQTALGWLMQKIKTESAENPPGFRYRSDMGSSDAFLGDPVGVAMGPGAVYETDQYVDNGADGITAGTLMYADDDGKIEDTNADSGALVAVALNTLSAADVTAGKMLRVKALL